MSFFGDALSDVGDAANAVAGAASDVAGDVLSIAEVIPGVSNAVTFFGDELQDFANTTLGAIALRALASCTYYGLATVLGPQLAAISFAIPGVAKGDSFDKAWLAEFLYRCEKTADILGAGAAGELAAQFQPAMNQLLQSAQDAGLDVQTFAKQLETQTGESLSELASKYGVSAMALQTAIDFAAKQVGFKSAQDAYTSVYNDLIASGESAFSAILDAAAVQSAAVQHSFDENGNVIDPHIPVALLTKSITGQTKSAGFAKNILLLSSKKKAPVMQAYKGNYAGNLPMVSLGKKTVMRTGNIHLPAPVPVAQTTVVAAPAAPHTTTDHPLAAKIPAAVAAQPASTTLKIAAGAAGVGFLGLLGKVLFF